MELLIMSYLLYIYAWSKQTLPLAGNSTDRFSGY